MAKVIELFTGMKHRIHCFTAESFVGTGQRMTCLSSTPKKHAIGAMSLRLINETLSTVYEQDAEEAAYFRKF